MDFKNMIKMPFFKCLHTNRYMKHEKNYIRFNLQTLFDKTNNKTLWQLIFHAVE